MKRLIMAVAVGICGAAMAAETPVMVSLVTPVQYPSRYCDVTGFGLSLIYGECQDFTGFDLGIVNVVHGETYGLALGGANIARERMYGAQVGLFNKAADIYGCQFGLVNCAAELHGAQMGPYVFLCVNYAECVTGCQLGLVNVAERVEKGIQVGIVNINQSNGWAPVLPLINGGF